MIRASFATAFFVLITGCTRGPAPFDSKRAAALWPAMNIRATNPEGGITADFEGEDGRAGKKLRLTVYENIEPAKAGRILELEAARLKNIFRNDVLPYHGAISRNTGCEKGEKPRFESSADTVTMEMLTNERLVPGSCDPGQAFYRASIRFLHCPKERRLFLLHVYVPKSQAAAGSSAPESGVLTCAG